MWTTIPRVTVRRLLTSRNAQMVGTMSNKLYPSFFLLSHSHFVLSPISRSILRVIVKSHDNSEGGGGGGTIASTGGGHSLCIYFHTHHTQPTLPSNTLHTPPITPHPLLYTLGSFQSLTSMGSSTWQVVVIHVTHWFSL